MCITATKSGITKDTVLVEKFIETIGGKHLSNVMGYNYDTHDPEKSGEYYSYPLRDGRGNAVLEIPKATPYEFDNYKNTFKSEKISRIVRWKTEQEMSK